MINWCRQCNKNTVSRPGKECAACWLYGGLDESYDNARLFVTEFNTVDLKQLRELRGDWRHYVKYGY